MSEDTQERDIGRLEGKLDRILDEQCNAAQDRRSVLQKLEEMSNRNVQTDMKIEHLSSRVSSLEAPVAEFSRWRERFNGVVIFISFVSAGTVALLVTAGKWVWAAIAG
jgi:uncharacterized protein YigA (DUF484 family)